MKTRLFLRHRSEFLDAVFFAMGSSAGKMSNGNDWAGRWAMAILLQEGLKSGEDSLGCDDLIHLPWEFLQCLQGVISAPSSLVRAQGVSRNVGHLHLFKLLPTPAGAAL